MKHCPRCHLNKHKREFYLSRRSPDGVARICGACTREVQAEWRDEHRDEEADRLAEYRRQNAAVVAERQREYRAANPEKTRARNMVAKAIARGTMPRPIRCSVCGTTERKVHYHHRSFGKNDWMDAVPLCQSCEKKGLD